MALLGLAAAVATSVPALIALPQRKSVPAQSAALQAPTTALPIQNPAQALAGRDPRMRGAALRALIAQGPAADKEVRPQLTDVDAEVRIAALAFYGQVPVSSAFPAIASSITDTDPRVRARAARTLAKFAPTLAIPKLIQSVGDPSAEVRVNTTSALALLGHREIIPTLQQTAMSSTLSAHERQAAILSLAQLRASEAAPDLMALAANTGEADKTRGMAVLALGQMAGSVDSAAYLNFFKDASPTVRFNAAAGASALRGAQIESALISIIRDGSERDFVRVRAMWSLADVGTATAAAELLQRAREEAEFIAMHAVRVLVERRIDGAREAAAALRSRSADPFVQTTLDSLLRRIDE